jgi:hypothetical protein
MNTRKHTAHFAGLLYLLWILTAVYGLLIVQPKTIVAGDASATAEKILAHEFLFRTGIVNGVLSSFIWVVLGVTLYKLFREVNESLARLLVALVIVQVPATFIMEACSIASLMVCKGSLLASFEIVQREEFAILLLKFNDYVTIALEMFWGLWLFPFGQLVIRSGFIPRILGVFLIVNGIAYVIHFLTHVLWPEYQQLVFRWATPVWTLGEISIMLWLLVKGCRKAVGC